MHRATHDCDHVFALSVRGQHMGRGFITHGRQQGKRMCPATNNLTSVCHRRCIRRVQSGPVETAEARHAQLTSLVSAAVARMSLSPAAAAAILDTAGASPSPSVEICIIESCQTETREPPHWCRGDTYC